MVSSIVSRSQLEGALRLDAEYYQPEFLETKKKVLSRPYTVLGEHAFVTDGEHGSVDFVETGVKFLVAENVEEGFLDVGEIRYVSNVVDKRNRRASLEAEDVTLSIKGTVGMAAVVFAEDLPANMNRDVSRIHVKEKETIDPYYLAVFLNSKWGRGQTLRESSGNVQQMITLGRIRELLVPKIAREQVATIRNLYLQARSKLIGSNQDYRKAEDTLLGELGLAGFQPLADLSYVVQFSETDLVDRFDAEYFQPKYKALVKRLEGHNPKPLPEVVQPVRPSFVPQAEPTHTFRYVELADIYSPIGVVDGSSEFLGSEAPSRARRMLKTGDVIVSSVEGSLEKVALVDAGHDGCLASTGFFQFRSKSFLPEVLLVLAKNLVLQMQLEKQATGTILSAVPSDSLKDVYLPKIHKTSQEKIADLVRQSHESRRKAKQLFEEAKRKVEETIEKEAAKYAKT